MCYLLIGWLRWTACGTGRWRPCLGWCCVIRHWLWIKIFSWSLFKSVIVCWLDQCPPQITIWCVLYQFVYRRLILWSQTQSCRHLMLHVFKCETLSWVWMTNHSLSSRLPPFFVVCDVPLSWRLKMGYILHCFFNFNPNLPTFLFEN